MLQTTKQGDALTVYLTGEIDHCVAEGLRNEIEMLIVAHDPHRLILDFSQVSFMDSSGIALILSALRRAREIGGKLRVSHVPHQAMRVLNAAGIERLVEIVPEVEREVF